MSEIGSKTVNPAQEEGKEEAAKNIQVIVFKLGEEEYGLMIDQIKEVVITPPVTRIPLMPSFVKGVANVRGDILTVIDLEEKFAVTASEKKVDKNYILVVAGEQLKMGVMVNEVPNTLAITESQIDESASVLQDEDAGGNYIRGIIKAENRLIILIDIFKVLTKEEMASFAKN